MIKLELLDYTKRDKGGYDLIFLREPPTENRKRGKRRWVTSDELKDKIQKGLVEVEGVSITKKGTLKVKENKLKSTSLEINDKKIASLDRQIAQETNIIKKRELTDRRVKLKRKSERLIAKKEDNYTDEDEK